MPPPTIIDLTKVSVSLRVEFDKLDLLLFVVTGGVGCLLRAAYSNYSEWTARNVELQTQNYAATLEKAQSAGAPMVRIRVHPEVPLYAPNGGEIRYLAQTSDYNEVEIVLS